MNINRDTNGIFSDGIGMGATPADQIRAGVNGYDTRETAASKIAMQNFADGVHQRSPARGGGLIRLDVGIVGRMFWILPMLAALIWFSYNLYEEKHYPSLMIDNYADMAGSSLNINGAIPAPQRENSVERMRPLFKEGTPVEKIFQYCRNKFCYEPDWQAFEKMRQYAARPKQYESDVCMYMTRVGDYPVMPVFARSTKRANICSMQNYREFRDAQVNGNIKIGAMVGGIFLFGLFALHRLNRFMKKHD